MWGASEKVTKLVASGSLVIEERLIIALGYPNNIRNLYVSEDPFLGYDAEGTIRIGAGDQRLPTFWRAGVDGVYDTIEQFAREDGQRVHLALSF